MKKLLSLLSVLTISGTSLPTAVAASNYEKNDDKEIKNKDLNRKKREKKDKFLPKLIKNTKLGKIPTNSEENILDQVVRLNRNINRNDISVTTIVHNQAQIVLRETLENNSLIENNFIWVTFETNPEVEMKAGNSIFYNKHPRYYEQQSLLNQFFQTNLNTVNLGIIPDNRGTTIMDYIREQNFFFGRLAEQFHELTLRNITSSTAIISLHFTESIREELLVTFTPQRIDLNSIITINDLGRVNSFDVLERIFELYPQLRNINLFVSYVSPTVVEIFVSDDNPLYLGRVSVSFENAGIVTEINKKVNNHKDDGDDDYSKKYDKNEINWIKKAMNKFNLIEKEKKQDKLNEINQHYENLSKNDKQKFKDKLIVIGTSVIGHGVSVVGTKMIASGSTSSVAVSTSEAIEMTPLLSEGLTAAETLSVAEGTAIATETAAAALAPETLGLSLVIGGLVIAGTAILWWLNSDHQTITKHESSEIYEYNSFLQSKQINYWISNQKWNKFRKYYEQNVNNFEKFKKKMKQEIVSFHQNNNYGRELTFEDYNILIKIIFNHFQEINNHFSNNSNTSWRIWTNTIDSWFFLEKINN